MTSTLSTSIHNLSSTTSSTSTSKTTDLQAGLNTAPIIRSLPAYHRLTTVPTTSGLPSWTSSSSTIISRGQNIPDFQGLMLPLPTTSSLQLPLRLAASTKQFFTTRRTEVAKPGHHNQVIPKS